MTKLRQGQRIAHPLGAYDDLNHFAVVDNAGRTVAIVEVVDGMLQPVKVLVGGIT